MKKKLLRLIVKINHLFGINKWEYSSCGNYRHCGDRCQIKHIEAGFCGMDEYWEDLDPQYSNRWMKAGISLIAIILVLLAVHEVKTKYGYKTTAVNIKRACGTLPCNVDYTVPLNNIHMLGNNGIVSGESAIFNPETDKLVVLNQGEIK
jgi:hypothetical protein